MESPLWTLWTAERGGGSQRSGSLEAEPGTGIKCLQFTEGVLLRRNLRWRELGRQGKEEKG